MRAQQYTSPVADSIGTTSRTVTEITAAEGAGASSKCADDRRNPPQVCVGLGRHSRELRGIAETSAEAFHSLSVPDYLQPKERAILALFTGPEVRLSRQQIAAALQLAINSVCGRVDSLLTARHLEEFGDRVDPGTGKRQKLLQLPRAAQASLLEVGA